MKSVELGSESFLENWEFGNGWENLTFDGHNYFGSMRNSGDFSSRDCMSIKRDCCGALKRPHLYARSTFVVQEKHDTLRTHVHCLTVSSAQRWDLGWADFIHWTWLFDFLGLQSVIT